MSDVLVLVQDYVNSLPKNPCPVCMAPLGTNPDGYTMCMCCGWVDEDEPVTDYISKVNLTDWFDLAYVTCPECGDELTVDMPDDDGNSRHACFECGWVEGV